MTQQHDSLRATAANSAKWAMLQMVGATGGRLLFTLIFARLLGPDDFGIMAAAMVYISLVMLLLDQGFGAAIIQRQDLHDRDIRTVSTLNVGLAVFFAAVTLLAAPLVADFFATPELTAVLRVLACGLLVKALTIVPLTLTRRQFGFRQLAIIQSTAVLVGGCAGLVAIAAGAGYWALVVQTLVIDALVLVALLSRRGLPRFGVDRARLSGLFRFSLGLVGAQLLMFASQNADNVIIGRVLGATTLGFYAVAYRLQRFPMQLVGSAVNDVALPVFSRLQGDRQRMRGWYLTATRFVVLLVWPVLVLMAVGADLGVPLVIGSGWDEAVVPLQLLSIGSLFIIPRWLIAPLLTACGRTGLVFMWTCVTVTCLVTAFLIAVQFGLPAVAASAGAVAIAVGLPQTFHVSRIIGMSWTRYLGSHVPMVVGCAVLAVIWRTVAWTLDGRPVVLVMVIATLASLVGYVGAVRVLWPTVASECRSIVGLSRDRLARRGSADATAG